MITLQPILGTCIRRCNLLDLKEVVHVKTVTWGVVLGGIYFKMVPLWPFVWYLTLLMKIKMMLFIFIVFLGSFAVTPDHLSKDNLKDVTGMIAHKKWLMEEIDMVERELRIVEDSISTARLLIRQQATVDESDLDGEIEKYSSDLSRYEYEKIDLIKELGILKKRL
jgi:hypothetical protein